VQLVDLILIVTLTTIYERDFTYRLMHTLFHIKTYQDYYHPSTDIDPRAKALWPISVSREDNSLDMEKGMH
jgi:hypothetical protein